MSDYQVESSVAETVARLSAAAPVERALAALGEDHERRVAEQVEIAEIAAPPFGEQERAADYRRRLAGLGLEAVAIDAEGNVIGRLRGRRGRPCLVLSAHLDTVFASGYDPRVTRDPEGILHGPGIGDDSAGLAALLSVVRGLTGAGLEPVGDLLVAGTVGEEGLGDLRGVKHLLESQPGIDGFISIDGEGVARIVYQGLGSKRFEIVFTGPGGHSYAAFGKVPNPLHAMGRAIARIADLEVPDEPRTTFSVSIADSGTSVNAIPERARMQVDVRSARSAELAAAASRIANYARLAAIAENQRWGIGWDSPEQCAVEIRLIGDRPPGTGAPDALHVQAAWAAALALGQRPELRGPISTDANVPIHLGIPALTLGPGGRGGRIHSLGEWFDPAGAHLGPQHVLLTALALAGLEGVSEPLLSGRGG